MSQPSPSQPIASSPSVPPSPQPRLTICPYCGARCRGLAACEGCRGKFDPLSRQATQNAMGPWFVRDESNPYRPGCSYETLARLVGQGRVTAETVVRGPGSRQFWTLAAWCPGVAHLLGVCHSCQQPVSPGDGACGRCGASFEAAEDRQRLGLGEVRGLPGRPAPQVSAREETRAPGRARAPAGVSAGPLAGAGANAIVTDPRVPRLQRELRRARRWRLVWLMGCVVLAVGIGAVVLAPALDLDAGPVGRWLAAREGAVGRGPEASQDAPAVVPMEVPGVQLEGGANAVSGGTPADPANAAEDTAPNPGSGPGEQAWSDDESANAAPAGTSEPAARAASESRLAVLARLRALR